MALIHPSGARTRHLTDKKPIVSGHLSVGLMGMGWNSVSRTTQDVTVSMKIFPEVRENHKAFLALNVIVKAVQ